MITRNRKDLEFKCDQVYFTDALKIVKDLKMEVLLKKNAHCVGLAHNQIRGRKCVFIAKLGSKWRSFINPEVVHHGDAKYRSVERCMSFPNKWNKVDRFFKISIRHQVKARSDHTGDAFIVEGFHGSEAQIIQHELDHINGIHIFNKTGGKENE